MHATVVSTWCECLCSDNDLWDVQRRQTVGFLSNRRLQLISHKQLFNWSQRWLWHNSLQWHSATIIPTHSVLTDSFGQLQRSLVAATVSLTLSALQEWPTLWCWQSLELGHAAAEATVGVYVAVDRLQSPCIVDERQFVEHIRWCFALQR